MRWEVVEPPGACDHPDGHDWYEVCSFASTVPERVICRHCPTNAHVAVFATPKDADAG